MINLATVVCIAAVGFLVPLVAYVCTTCISQNVLPSFRKRGTYFAWMFAVMFSLPYVLGFQWLQQQSTELSQLSTIWQIVVISGVVLVGCLYLWIGGLVGAHFLALDAPFPSRLSEYYQSIRRALKPARRA